MPAKPETPCTPVKFSHHQNPLVYAPWNSFLLVYTEERSYQMETSMTSLVASVTQCISVCAQPCLFPSWIPRPVQDKDPLRSKKKLYLLVLAE